MADPATMAALSIGTGLASSIGGAAVSATGQAAAGAASEASYKYRAGVALMNQKINQQNAAWATEAGGIQGMEAGLKARENIGAIKAQQAGSGFDVNSGTPAAVRDSQARASAFDQDVIRFDAAKAAYGYETRAGADSAEAQMNEMAGRNARTSGDLGVATSILGGASSVASKWMQGRNVGLWGDSSGGDIGLFNPSNYGAAPRWVPASSVEL